MVSRRQFAKNAVALAFFGLTNSALGRVSNGKNKLESNKMTLGQGYGPLIKDKNGLLDLPDGFRYHVISKLGDRMDDGINVPDRADGMGCFYLDNDRVTLIRNHELSPKHLKYADLSIQSNRTKHTYDVNKDGVALPGGTTNVVYNMKTQRVEHQCYSLVGTIRNCAGGETPWGSWLSCEESVRMPDTDIGNKHGYVFEVFANSRELTAPKPIPEMGRFNHEAAAVDPRTGIVYLTEDRGDSLFYRFIPNVKGHLEKGGVLQALAVKQHGGFDTRNWHESRFNETSWLEVEWITLQNPDVKNDDLRLQGYQKGAALFARGEGIYFGDNELYFCCTNGGQAQLGQIMRYQPSAYEGSENESQHPGMIQLFLESHDKSLYNFGDNLTVTPWGHLLVCEDQYSDVTNNHIRGVTDDGAVYAFAKLNVQTEPAGVCFSPDGKVLFVNLYSPTKTLAITGPWESIKG